MSNKIKKGTEVKWSSSGRGSKAAKRGEVVRYLEKGANVRDFISKKVLVSQIMTRNYDSSHQRYLVAVIKGGETFYFTPRAATINEQNGFAEQKTKRSKVSKKTSKASKKASAKPKASKKAPKKKLKAKAKKAKAKTPAVVAVTEAPATEAAKAA